MPQTFYPGQLAADYLAELNALAAGQAATATPTFAGLTITGNTTLGDAEATDTLTVKGASTILANSANPALKVTQTGSGNAFVVEDAASDTTPFVIDASGQVVVGHTANLAGTSLEVINSITRFTYANNAFSGGISQRKSRGASVGSRAIVQSGDELGNLFFYGDDGASDLIAARVTAFVDGTPGAGDMPGRLVFSTTPDGSATPVEAMRIGNDRAIYLGAAPGAESLRVVPVASAVNRMHLLGAATGVPVTTVTEGSDAAVTAVWAAKGAASHTFRTGGVSGSAQFLVAHAASAVNYAQVNGNPTTFGPVLSSQGSDSNSALNITSKGASNVTFYTNNATNVQFNVAHTASAVNYAQVTGGATGSPVTVSAQGSDAVIDLALTPKSTGVVRFGTWTANADAAVNGYVTIKDAAGNVRKLATIA